MKKLVILSLLAALAALPLSALAAEAYVYTEVLSAYVFNGQVGNDEAVFQPGLDVTGPIGLGYSLWANMALTDADSTWDPNTGGEWSEFDMDLTWTTPWEGPVSLTLAGRYYVYPQATSSVDEEGNPSEAPADGNYEVYLKAKATDCVLSPTLKFYHDMANTDDWIALFSIGHSFKLLDKLSLDLTGTISYSGEYYVESNYGSDTGAAFTHAQLDAVLNFAVTEQASLGLKGSFSSIVDGDVRDDIEESDLYPEVDIFFGGVTAGYSF